VASVLRGEETKPTFTPHHRPLGDFVDHLFTPTRSASSGNKAIRKIYPPATPRRRHGGMRTELLAALPGPALPERIVEEGVTKGCCPTTPWAAV